MNKKILALALAIVFVATAFTACKKTPELTEINGKEYPLETNKDGNTIINDENQIAVIVTDKNGEAIKVGDGENQTHWLQINGPIVIEGKVQSGNYSFGIPSGWEGEEISGRVVKSGTDGDCYIQIMKVKTLDTDEKLETYLEQIDAQNTAIAEAFNDEEQMATLIAANPSYEEFAGCQYTVAEGSVLLPGGMHSLSRVNKIVNKDGKLLHYAENYYFLDGKDVYKVDYICENGNGYDETFDFPQYLEEHFTYKLEK